MRQYLFLTPITVISITSLYCWDRVKTIKVGGTNLDTDVADKSQLGPNILNAVIASC